VSTPALDFRSDTVTRPSLEMREAMAGAEVGDDVFGEDPTLRALEAATAALLDKEAALFVPSGTMSNQIALLLHTRPGDEVLVGQGAHIASFESGAGAALAGVQFTTLGNDGFFSADDLEAATRPERDWLPRTRLVELENTHNLSGGRIFPDKDVRRIIAAARRLGLGLHLDGARIWNAAEASGLAPAVLAAGFDTVSVCFSKGLGAPVGSALAGSSEHIRAARRFRKMLGGGMRQAGILAAAALFALERNRSRLALDHEHARLLVTELTPLAEFGIEPLTAETNIVLVRCGGTAEALSRQLAEAGVLVSAMDRHTLRFVTHLDVGRAEVLEAAQRARRVLERGRG
jgi:threonine aldolase